MDIPPVIVAGAGIAGLSTALALGHHDVRILEKAPLFSEVGAGLQIGPNAVRALQKLGAWDAVEPITSKPPAIHVRDGLSGKILKQMQLGRTFEERYGAPYRVAHRADLHAALLNVVRARSNISCETNTIVEDVGVQLQNVTYKIRGQLFSAPYLVAADGVQSAIRQSLFPNSKAINSGHILHRALIAVPALPEVDLDCVNLWMFPGGHVVHYPVGRNARLNIVVVTQKDTTPEKHFTNAANGLQMLLNAAQGSFSPWPGLYAPPLQNWTKGGVLLLGDAAHGSLPYLAQGAAMAIEDAAILAGSLKTAHSLKHAFAETAMRRMERTTRLQTASLSAGHRYHLMGLARHARNAAISLMPMAAFQSQVSWIYDYSPDQT